MEQSTRLELQIRFHCIRYWAPLKRTQNDYTMPSRLLIGHKPIVNIPTLLNICEGCDASVLFNAHTETMTSTQKSIDNNSRWK